MNCRLRKKLVSIMLYADHSTQVTVLTDIVTNHFFLCFTKFTMVEKQSSQIFDIKNSILLTRIFILFGKPKFINILLTNLLQNIMTVMTIQISQS